MVPMFQRTVLAFAILASATTFTPAAENQEARKACADDANTHCPDEVPDREKVYACLVQKVAQISVPCRKIINESIAASRPQRRK